MQEYTIVKISRFTQDKDGNQLKTKDGREYTRVRIQVAEYGESWISGFGSQNNSSWKEGDTVKLAIEKKGDYLNFQEPKKDDVANQKLELILTKLGKIELAISILNDRVK